jgi:hypothetical protein
MPYAAGGGQGESFVNLSLNLSLRRTAAKMGNGARFDRTG